MTREYDQAVSKPAKLSGIEQTTNEPGIGISNDEEAVEAEKETQILVSKISKNGEEKRSCTIGDGDGMSKSQGNDDRVPIDKGWAWVVAFSCFVIVFVFSAIEHVVATLLTDILEEFDISVSVISNTLSAASLGRCLTTMIAANVLLPRMSIRVMVTCASICNAVCTLAVVVLPSVVVFCGALFLKELNKGFTIISVLTLVGHYFRRHRGLATALGLMGFSMRGTVVPPLIRYMKDEFGFRPALLLFAGFEMQAIIVSLLLRPINSYISKGTISQAKKIDRREQKCPNNMVYNVEPKSYGESASSENKNLDDIELKENVTVPDNYHSPVTYKRVAKLEKSDNQLQVELVNKDFTSGLKPQHDTPKLRHNNDDSLVLSKDTLSTVHSTNQDEKSQQNTKQKSCILPERCSWLKDMLQVLNPALFTHCVCLVLCLAYSVNICAQFVLLYLPTYAQSVGVSKTDSASLLTIAGVAEFGGRLLSGLLGDQKWLRPATIISTSSLILCVTCQLAGLLRTFWSLAGFASVIGLLGCFGQNLMSVLIVDGLGLDRLASVLAMGSLFGAVTFSIAHAIHGVLIEATGGFLASFSLTGCGFLVGAILLFSLPLAKKLQSRKERTEEREKEETESSDTIL
ncbi:hypothetical protein EGW08_014712 [Elysia chlorotica]|uniref:Major facilitator superfamily (MFS) profile domain-containing protein n=1 Tax=Elysia chlorotica TaxID=188477 RepID=A0A433T7M9_ELYCH|nr:hypothetical protein EGW08_014712 [Elysia chlorotica]